MLVERISILSLVPRNKSRWYCGPLASLEVLLEHLPTSGWAVMGELRGPGKILYFTSEAKDPRINDKSKGD